MEDDGMANPVMPFFIFLLIRGGAEGVGRSMQAVSRRLSCIVNNDLRCLYEPGDFFTTLHVVKTVPGKESVCSAATSGFVELDEQIKAGFVMSVVPVEHRH